MFNVYNCRTGELVTSQPTGDDLDSDLRQLPHGAYVCYYERATMIADGSDWEGVYIVDTDNGLHIVRPHGYGLERCPYSGVGLSFYCFPSAEQRRA
jgi:hypothetical protein